MVSSKLILSAALLSVGAIAQDNTALPYNNTEVDRVNLGLIEGGPTRIQAICRGQQNTCVDLCLGQGQTGANTCDSTGLTGFECTCRNGTSPDLAPYTESLPAALCRESVNQCTAEAIQQFPSGPNQLPAVTNCQQTAHCGDQNSTEVRVGAGAGNDGPAATGASPSATSAAPSGDSTAPASTSGGTAAEPSQGAAAIAQSYGTSIVAAGLLAVFGLAL